MTGVAPSATRRRPRRGARSEGPRARFSSLLPYLLEHRTALVVVAILSVIGAVASLAQPLIVGRVIERVQSGDALGMLVWLLIALVVVASAISGYQHYLLQRTGTAVVYSSRRELIARLLRLPIAQYDRRRTGDLVSRVGTDTTLLYAVLTQGLADSVGNLLIFVGAIVAMAIIDPLLLGLIILVVGGSVAIVALLSGRIRTATAAQQEHVGALSSGVERAVGGIRTIRAARAESREQAELDASARDAYRAGVRVAQASALVVPLAGLALQLSLLVVLGVGGFRVASEALSIAGLVTFVMFLFFLLQPLASFFGAITSVSQALGALGRIREITELAPESAGPDLAADQSDSDGAAIEFRNVSFGYPDDVVTAWRAGQDDADDGAARSLRDVILDDVSFRVPTGSRVALVGPSGAGKSTALALIERFYDVTSGAILIDGHDIRSMPRADLRGHLGYVEQDAPTLAGTIGENLRLGNPEASDDACLAVLDAVNLGSVVRRSELGLRAPVGEDGVMLSGGERQRLAIARALLTEAPILLLDESTSSLDSLNEQRMRAAIDAVSADRTLLVIAHRLATVVDSDLIIVLERGRVVGMGRHEELVATVPLYRELARHQLLV